MKDEKYTIGEFSKLTGISKDTLRFYDKIGLLQPKYVGESSRYRYYTFDQFWYADMVIGLQRLNVPLQQIIDVFAKKTDGDIIELMRGQKEEALRLSEYYMRVADDIEWYARQQRILEAGALGEKSRQDSQSIDEPIVHVEYFTQREVLYYRHAATDSTGYKVKLENLSDCHEELKTTDSIKRVRGCVLDADALRKNELHIIGSYIDIGMSGFEHVDGARRYELPAGEYACYVAEVIDGNADFTPLLDWLQEHDRIADLVIADDLGLSFFEGNEDITLCEVKIFLRG